MDYPIIFPLRERLTGQRPDAVRDLLESSRFRRHRTRPSIAPSDRFRGASEIWYRLAGPGYAVVRIDSQGHANLMDRDGNEYAIGGVSAGVHGGVPHYHKEWISADYFRSYLNTYVPQVVRYNDAGDPVTGAMTDGKAKATHIRQ